MYCFRDLKLFPEKTNDIRINCSFNKIRQIINIPTNIKTLECFKNKIRVIKNCPNLREINADNNRIKNISYFPKIEEFEIGRNKIKDFSRRPMRFNHNKYLEYMRTAYMYDPYVKKMRKIFHKY